MRNRFSRAANKSLDRSANEALNNQGGNNYEFFVNIFRASFSLQNRLPGNAVRPYATSAPATFREQPGIEPATFLSGGRTLCFAPQHLILYYPRFGASKFLFIIYSIAIVRNATKNPPTAGNRTANLPVQSHARYAVRYTL